MLKKLCIVSIIICINACSNSQYEHLDYYANGSFKNLEGQYDLTLWDVFVWQTTSDAEKWPEHVPLELPKAKPEQEPKAPEPIITFINHSTFLIQVDGINILTDPVFSKRVSPVQWIGPKRVQDVGVDKEDIPKIDIIMISHNHYDHLDYNSLEFFKQRDNPKILAGLGVGSVDDDFEITELEWWQEVKTDDWLISFTPCQHFSGRGLFDRNKSLWGGFYYQSKSFSFYFAGDTGYSSHFKEVKKRYPDIDIAIIPVGAYEPQWFMNYIHVNPQQAVLAHEDLDPKLSIAMHWGTFQLSDEGYKQPITDLNKELKKKNIENFIIMKPAEVFKWQELSY